MTPGRSRSRRSAGGNSNETLALHSPAHTRVLRRPPAEAISPSAHSMDREHRILSALHETAVPAPAALALCTDTSVPGAPFLVMEAIEGVALTDTRPATLPADAATTTAIGHTVIDALAAVHSADWRAIGLDDFGRPENFVARQVPRWSSQLERYRRRELPWFDEVGEWLAANAPPDGQPGILHGDFHLDNCLLSDRPPVRVAAIIDWEMATIGDPLLDLGLFLAFWGPDRPAAPAMPRVQAVSRVDGAATREELAARYERASGRSVEHLPWYMVLAFWKLAAIVEGAYTQFLEGTLLTPYAEALGTDVPRLLSEAAGFAGIRQDD